MAPLQMPRNGGFGENQGGGAMVGSWPDLSRSRLCRESMSPVDPKRSSEALDSGHSSINEVDNHGRIGLARAASALKGSGFGHGLLICF